MRGHLPVEELTLVARAPGYVSSELQTVFPDEPVGDIVLEPLAFLSGVAVDAVTGKPVSSFQIIIQRRRSDPSRYPTHYPPRDFADPWGKFFIDGLPAAGYVIAIRAPGYAVELAEPVFTAGEGVSLRFELKPGRTLRVIVRDVKGERPLPDMYVSCYVPSREAWTSNVGQTPYDLTGEDGVAVIDGLLPAKYRLHVRHPEYKVVEGPREFTIAEEDHRETRLEVRVARRTGGKLTGTIENFHARGAVESYVVLVSLSGEKPGPLRFRVDPDGKYTGREIPPGDYEVRCAEMYPTEKGREHRERTGGISLDDTVEETIHLGAVTIAEGETATFDHSFETAED